MSLCFLGTTPCLLSLAVTESGPIPRLSVLDLAPGSPFLPSLYAPHGQHKVSLLDDKLLPHIFPAAAAPTFFADPRARPSRTSLRPSRETLYKFFFAAFKLPCSPLIALAIVFPFQQQHPSELPLGAQLKEWKKGRSRQQQAANRREQVSHSGMCCARVLRTSGVLLNCRQILLACWCVRQVSFYDRHFCRLYLLVATKTRWQQRPC